MLLEKWMAYTGWNQFRNGKYWPGLVGTGWNRMEPVGTDSNLLEQVSAG
jgi:hypothetical protein